MKRSIVVVGIGEIGSVFARGFMRLGHPVVPVTRDQSMADVAADVSDPEMVMIAVGEKDLHGVLADVPDAWKDRLLLIQNELLPDDWERHELSPTVISVWFEKKKGMDSKVLIPSPVFGPHASLVSEALASLDIASRVVDTAEQLLHELVVKNVYILTTNIAGLRVGGNVETLWGEHQALARSVAADVIAIQEALTGQSLAAGSLIDDMVHAFDGDPQHGCMGRSAPARLQRALAIASERNIEVPTLQSIADEQAA